MSEVNKGEVEQVKINGRNYDAVVRQLVDKYNSSEGWSVVRVVPSILSLDVYLERNTKQAKGGDKQVDKDTPKDTEATVSKTPIKNNLGEGVSNEKEKQTTPKKTATGKATTKK